MTQEETFQIIRNWRKSAVFLPDDFDWTAGGVKNTAFSPAEPVQYERLPLIEEAILYGYPLPYKDEIWTLRLRRDRGGWHTVAHHAAVRNYKFSPSFSHWAITNSDECPVIHELVRHHVPPAHFDQWHIKSLRGRSAAHAYLSEIRKPLPADFKDWHLEDQDGQTVAYLATLFASFKGNPDFIGFLNDCAIWTLRNNEGSEFAGETPLHFAMREGLEVPDLFTQKDWEIPSAAGVRVIDLARQKGRLEIVSRYESLCLASRLASEINPPETQTTLPVASRISRSTF